MGPAEELPSLKGKLEVDALDLTPYLPTGLLGGGSNSDSQPSDAPKQSPLPINPGGLFGR